MSLFTVQPSLGIATSGVERHIRMTEKMLILQNVFMNQLF